MAGDNSENPYDAVLQLKRGCQIQPRSTNLEAPNKRVAFPHPTHMQHRTVCCPATSSAVNTRMDEAWWCVVAP